MSEGKEMTKRFLEERDKTFRGGRRVGNFKHPFLWFVGCNVRMNCIGNCIATRETLVLMEVGIDTPL